MAVTRPGEKPALPSGSTIIGLLVIFSEALNSKRAAGRALIARPTQGSQRFGASTARVSLIHRPMSIYGNGFAAASEPRFERLQDLRVHRDVVVLASAPGPQHAAIHHDLEVVRDGGLREVEVRAQLAARELADRGDRKSVV